MEPTRDETDESPIRPRRVMYLPLIFLVVGLLSLLFGIVSNNLSFKVVSISAFVMAGLLGYSVWLDKQNERNESQEEEP